MTTYSCVFNQSVNRKNKVTFTQLLIFQKKVVSWRTVTLCDETNIRATLEFLPHLMITFFPLKEDEGQPTRKIRVWEAGNRVLLTPSYAHDARTGSCQPSHVTVYSVTCSSFSFCITAHYCLSFPSPSTSLHSPLLRPFFAALRLLPLFPLPLSPSLPSPPLFPLSSNFPSLTSRESSHSQA